MFLLDTLAVGIAGARAPFADAVLGGVADGAQGGAQGVAAGGARVLGRAAPTSVRAAAFANAYQIHAQEFDCVHEPAVLHPCSAALGAMAAVASAGAAVADGATFGAALVAAVDVTVGLGLAGRGALTFFRPATAGIFGATAGVARLRGLTRPQAVAAFGHALSFASGTMQAHVEGTPGLALQVGAAASQAVLAVALAGAGVPGARGSVDGPWGYLRMFEPDHDAAPVLASLGRDFAVTGLSHKPYPTGRAAHGAIAAVQRLAREHGVAGGQVAALRYVAPSLIARLVGRPAHAGMGVAYARLCLPYLAARTAWHGGVGLESFTPDALADAPVLALAGRVEVLVDDNPDPAAFTPARLEAELADGRRIDIAVTAVPGGLGAPLDRAARLDKVRRCLAFGGLALDAETLADAVARLGETHDIGHLLALASAPPATRIGSNAA